MEFQWQIETPAMKDIAGVLNQASCIFKEAERVLPHYQNSALTPKLIRLRS
jgi:hypothetical protein